MKIKKVALLILLTIAMVSSVSAEIKHVSMRVEGMTWNFWAYGVEQHLGRQSGVQKVQVSLIDGKVEITPKTDGLIDPIALLKATYDSGVSVAEMSMIARGRIIKTESGGIALQTQPNQSFVILQNDLSPQLESMAGSSSLVTIRGLIFQKQKNQKVKTPPTELTIQVLEIQQKEWKDWNLYWFHWCSSQLGAERDLRKLTRKSKLL